MKPYSLAENFTFADVERMLANVPTTRKNFFEYAGISEQCWWDWKRTNRISVHAKDRMSSAYKYFRSKEYKDSVTYPKGLRSWDSDDIFAELERRGYVLERKVREV